MSGAPRHPGPDERVMIAAAAALAANRENSVANADLLIGELARVLDDVDRQISVELTAIALRADDLVAARRNGGPTWDQRRALERAVYRYFMRSLDGLIAAGRAGQEARIAG